MDIVEQEKHILPDEFRLWVKNVNEINHTELALLADHVDGKGQCIKRDDMHCQECIALVENIEDKDILVKYHDFLTINAIRVSNGIWVFFYK